MARIAPSKAAYGNMWAQIGISACVLLLPPIAVGAAVYVMFPIRDDGAAPPRTVVADIRPAIGAPSPATPTTGSIAPTTGAYSLASARQESVVKEPVVKAPLVKERVVKEPVAKALVVKERVVKEPVVKEPVVKEPLVKEPIVEEPLVNEFERQRRGACLKPATGPCHGRGCSTGCGHRRHGACATDVSGSASDRVTVGRHGSGAGPPGAVTRSSGGAGRAHRSTAAARHDPG